MASAIGWQFGGAIVIDDQGCIHWDPDPPGDPQDPRTPVSDGDLEDIFIYDNEVFDMGMNGIATLRFISKKFGPIAIVTLTIEFNRIHNNLQNDLGGKGINAALPVGFGGISLISVRVLSVRDNWIEENGPSHLDPVCGVFVRQGTALAFEQNRIRDNGQFQETAKAPTPGPRAGIWIGASKASLGLPTLAVQGNQVVSPLGPALEAVGIGPMLIEGN